MTLNTLIVCTGIFRLNSTFTWPRSADGNMSGNRCETDCRNPGGSELDPGLVLYFHGD